MITTTELEKEIWTRYGNFELSHVKNESIVKNILDFVLQKIRDGRENNETGKPITREWLKEKGFEFEVIDNDVKWWIKNGISIHEDSWWLDKDGNDTVYGPNEKAPDITFCYATYIKGDGSFKGGFIMQTQSQVENLYYALTSKQL